jgi:hypothetical protein
VLLCASTCRDNPTIGGVIRLGSTSALHPGRKRIVSLPSRPPNPTARDSKDAAASLKSSAHDAPLEPRPGGNPEVDSLGADQGANVGLSYDLKGTARFGQPDDDAVRQGSSWVEVSRTPTLSSANAAGLVLVGMAEDVGPKAAEGPKSLFSSLLRRPEAWIQRQGA